MLLASKVWIGLGKMAEIDSADWEDPSELEQPFGILGCRANQCFSRGELRLAAADPFVDPIVDEDMLSDERDLIRMRDGVRRLFALARHPEMAKVSDRVRLLHSGISPEEIQSIDELDDWILNGAIDSQHICGTCRMGDPKDPRSVVDPDCRVLGIENLRVIDASIMPDVPRTNPNVTVIASGEYMAARLLGEI